MYQVSRTELNELRRLLQTTLNEGELRTLCFDLGVDYESLPGVSKADKARELISFVERRGHLDLLVVVLQQWRPETFSDLKMTQATPETSLTIKGAGKFIIHNFGPGSAVRENAETQ